MINGLKENGFRKHKTASSKTEIVNWTSLLLGFDMWPKDWNLVWLMVLQDHKIHGPKLG